MGQELSINIVVNTQKAKEEVTKFVADITNAMKSVGGIGAKAGALGNPDVIKKEVAKVTATVEEGLGNQKTAIKSFNAWQHQELSKSEAEQLQAKKAAQKKIQDDIKSFNAWQKQELSKENTEQIQAYEAKVKKIADLQKRQLTLARSATTTPYQVTRLDPKQEKTLQQLSKLTNITVTNLRKEAQALKLTTKDLAIYYETMQRVNKSLATNKAATVKFFKDVRSGTTVKSLGRELGTTVSEKDVAVYDEINRKMPTLVGNMGKMNTALMSQYGWFGKLTSSIRNYIKFQIEWFAGAAVIFTLVAGFRKLVTSTFEFQQSLKDIQAVTMATKEEIDLLAAAAMNVSTETPIAAGEVAKMGLQLIRAGMNAKDAAVALNMVAKVATVAGEDAKIVADTVATAFFAWKMQAQDMAKVGNIIAATLNYSRLQVEDLGTAYNYLAGTASALNKSFSETNAIMAVFSNMGIKASTIGTGLAMVFGRLLVPTQKFRNTIKNLGGDISETDIAVHKFADVLEYLENINYDASLAMSQFGQRAGRILMFAMSAGSEAFRTMESRIAKSKQLTEGLAHSMEGPINQMKQMWNMLIAVAIRVGESMQPIFQAVIVSLKLMGAVLYHAVRFWTSLAGKIALAAIVINIFFKRIVLLIPVIMRLARTMFTLEFATGNWKRAILAILGLIAAGAIFDRIVGGADAGIEKLAAMNDALQSTQASLTETGNVIKNQENMYRRWKEEVADLIDTINQPWEIDPFLTLLKGINVNAGPAAKKVAGLSEQITNLKDKLEDLSKYEPPKSWLQKWLDYFKSLAEKVATTVIKPMAQRLLAADKTVGAGAAMKDFKEFLEKKGEAKELANYLVGIYKALDSEQRAIFANLLSVKDGSAVWLEIMRKVADSYGIGVEKLQNMIIAETELSKLTEQRARQAKAAAEARGAAINAQVRGVLPSIMEEALQQANAELSKPKIQRLQEQLSKKVFAYLASALETGTPWGVAMADMFKSLKSEFIKLATSDKTLKDAWQKSYIAAMVPTVGTIAKIEGATKKKLDALYKQWMKFGKERFDPAIQKQYMEMSQKFIDEGIEKAFKAGLKNRIKFVKEWFKSLKSATSAQKELLITEQAYAVESNNYNEVRRITVELIKSAYEQKKLVAQQNIIELEQKDNLSVADKATIANLNNLIKLYEKLLGLKVKSAGLTGAAKVMHKLNAEWNDFQKQWETTFESTMRNLAKSFSDIFYDGIMGKLKSLGDYFKSVWNGILRYFTDTLGRMAVQSMGFGGVTGAQQGQKGGVGGWLNTLLGTKMFGGTAGGYLGAGGMGLGVGNMMGGTTLSNLGGLAGGIGAYAAFSSGLMGGVWSGIASAATDLGGGAFGAMIGNIVPIIGTIIGAVVGSLLSSLFGGKIDKTPQMGMTYSPSGATRPEDFKYGGTTQYGAWYWGEGGEGDISDSAQRQVISKFKNLREKLKSVLEVMGGDLSKLTEDWASSSEKLSGEGSFKDAVGKWMADYVEFITNLDMTQFQKDGETIEDTINRIADAIIAFPDVVESFDRLIKAVSSGGDLDFQVDQFLWSAKKQAEDMVDIYNKMTSATDPADVEEYAKQLKQYLLDYYQSQVQFITDLQNRIEQLGVAMRSITTQAVDYLFNYAQKMKSYGMTPPMSNKDIFNAGADLYVDAYNKATSASEKFGIMNQAINFLYSYLDSEIADIKKKYQEMTEEAQKALDARREETRLALEIAKSWQQLADAIKETLYKLTTGTANPADIRERLGVAQSTVANLYQQYMSLTGEDKVKAAKELHDKIQSYLDLAQEAYQRPSTEYQTIYSNMISLLQMMESDSAARGSSVEDLQKELNDLTKQQIDLSEQMNAEIKSLTDEWQPFLTSMWDTAIDLYRQQLEEMQGQKDDLEAALKAVIGDQTVGEYIQNLRDDVVQALKNVQKAFIDAFEEALGHDIPGYATGGYVERRQLAWVAEKESEYIIPASKMDAVFARRQSANNSTITIAPSITVQIQGDTADPHRIAEEIELVLVDSIRHGHAGEAVKERMKYE